jgi:predicted anti-sigma-YlaC factor YlaD
MKPEQKKSAEEALLETHPEVLERLCETLGEDVDSPSCDVLRNHLEKCPGCRAYVDSLLKTISLYRIAEDAAPPAGLKNRLFDALNIPRG